MILKPMTRKSGLRQVSARERPPELRPPVGLGDLLARAPLPEALDRWQPGIHALAEDDETSISIYGAIGEDYWSGEGITSKRIAAALRRIGARPVTVNVNSPGGDFFEGVAIYNLLRAHSETVTVQIMALAASAASVIAMAGDTIKIARAGFMMIHNTWGVTVGNRHDMLEAAATLEQFDEAMAGVYAAHADISKAEAAKLMDKETWFNGERAVEVGLADDYVAADQVVEDTNAKVRAEAQMPVRRLDAILATNAGMSRSERRKLIGEIRAMKDFGGMQDAVAAGSTQDAAPKKATQDAGPGDYLESLRSLVDKY